MFLAHSRATFKNVEMNILTILAITLLWNAPTTNTDGTPLTDLAGYELGYSSEAGRYAFIVPTGNVTQFSYELPAGKHYVAVRALNTAEQRSDWSNEIIVGADVPTPSPTPTATPKPAPTPFASLEQCHSYVKAQALVYDAQTKLTAKYLAERNECRAN